MSPAPIAFLGRTQAETASEKLRSLANPARLMILDCLTSGERSVGDLERLLDLKQPGLSQQLAELRQAGWVATRRQSKSVFYRLAEPGLGLLLSALGDLLSGTSPAPATLLAPMHGQARIGDSPAPPSSQAAHFAVTGDRAL